MRERLWVALDVETLKEADGLLERLGGAGPAETIGAKIGSQLFTAAGPAAVETALKRGFAVFLDLKYHDIPNTVAGAVREATRIGVAMLNVHAGGGGADAIVVGRPITAVPDPKAAASAILSEIANVWGPETAPQPDRAKGATPPSDTPGPRS